MCAEFYDSIRDPITLYFTEKIQKTVSHRSVIQLFLKNNPGQPEETIATRKRKDTEDNLKRMLIEHDEKGKNEKKSRQSFNQKL